MLRYGISSWLPATPLIFLEQVWTVRAKHTTTESVAASRRMKSVLCSVTSPFAMQTYATYITFLPYMLEDKRIDRESGIYFIEEILMDLIANVFNTLLTYPILNALMELYHLLGDLGLSIVAL